jgi:beta-glucosidase
METVPASALFTTDGADRRTGCRGVLQHGILQRPGVPRSRKDARPAEPDAKPLFTRVDAEINFKWWDGAPRADMDDDNFGVRWVGFLAPPVTGKYRLGGVGMNAFEIYLNGKRWCAPTTCTSAITVTRPWSLEAGKLYPIRVDFHEVVNDADMRLVWAVPGRDLETAALDAARQAEAVVMFLGLSPRLEGEEMKVPVAGFQGGDRVDLGLPAAQEALLEKVAALGKPVVLVLLNGSALAVNWARDHVPAHRGGVVPGPGRRRRHRRCPVRRLQPGRPPCPSPSTNPPTSCRPSTITA